MCSMLVAGIRRFFLSRALAVAAVVVSASVLAAGKSGAAEPAYNWTGLYAGADAGFSWANANSTVSFGPLSSGMTQNSHSFIGSAIVGFDWEVPIGWTQYGVVVGGVVDLIGSDQKGSNTATVGVETFNVTLRNPWMTTFRGRFGVPFGLSQTWLAYATAGVGFGRFESTTTVSGPISGTLNDTTSRPVWIVGGGLEFAFSRFLSWKAEYLYLNTGVITTVSPNLGSTSLSTRGITESLVRSGFNFRF
jgi:outer membrane immunogenic protein